MVALDRKILRTIATQRYRKQFQQGSKETSSANGKRLSIEDVSEKLSTQLPGALPVKMLKNASDVIAAKRHSTEERHGSKGSSRAKSTSKSPRGRDHSAGKDSKRQANEQSQERLKERKERFEMMAGLEERAKEAADRHLQEQTYRVEALRADLKEKREAKLQKALLNQEAAHGQNHKKHEKQHEAVSPRKRTTMLRTTQRSLVNRVSLKLPLLDGSRSVVASPRSPGRSSRKV